jgi:hypothetical protein
MSHAEIRKLFDNNQSMTFIELVKLTKLPPQEVFYILTCEDEE